MIAHHYQGILNWKYKAEQALRSSGIPYTIVRATGLATGAPAPVTSTAAAAIAAGDDSKCSDRDAQLLSSRRRVQASQGDTVAGRITREELADLIIASLDSPYSAGTTFEVRRDESDSGLFSTVDAPNNWSGIAPTMTASGVEVQNFDSLFKTLVKDENRNVVGMVSFAPSAPEFTPQVQLPPFPVAMDPAQPVSAERVQQILNDPRVQSQQKREDRT